MVIIALLQQSDIIMWLIWHEYFSRILFKIGDRFRMWSLFYMHAPLLNMYVEKNKYFQFGKVWNKDSFVIWWKWQLSDLIFICFRHVIKLPKVICFILFIHFLFRSRSFGAHSFLILSFLKFPFPNDIINGHSHITKLVEACFFKQLFPFLWQKFIPCIKWYTIHSISIGKFWFFKIYFSMFNKYSAKID